MPDSTTIRSRSPVQIALVLLAILAAGIWYITRTSGGTDPSPAPTATANADADSWPDRRATSTGATHDLSIDEARGGHTLTRHVGRSDEDLRDRLRRERGISAASTYTDRAVAEATVAQTLAQNAARIAAWLARDGNRPNLALDYRGASSRPIGRSLGRNRQETVPCYDAIVVLRWDGRGEYVLTSYPETRR